MEAAVKECNSRRCFTPSEGPLAGLKTNEFWHKRNIEWIEKFNEKVETLISKARDAQVCGKLKYNYSIIEV